MTILIKYPRQNKETNKVFFEKKDKELTNLDWAKWGGWFDTDGSISSKSRRAVCLKLKDREPVELFSKTFETTLFYCEHKTVTPNGASYLAQEYVAQLVSEKSIWFTQNIKKYIFNKTKSVRDFLSKSNMDYIPYQHDLTKEELLNYISSALQGDGTFYDRYKTTEFIKLYSGNENYLKFLKEQLLKHGIFFGGPYGGLIYQTKSGTKQQFQLSLAIKNHEKAINFLEDIIPKIEMMRKREKAISSLKWLKK
jgi:hypothetical protein